MSTIMSNQFAMFQISTLHICTPQQNKSNLESFNISVVKF